MFTDMLWRDIAPIREEILAHPFIIGLRDGSLPEDRFGYYLVQDVIYLQSYACALTALASRAPREEWTALFATHALEVLRVESELHERLLAALGTTRGDAAAEPPSPTTTAYTSYLLARAYGTSFLDAVAAILPRYWILRDLGTALADAGSPRPIYAERITACAAPELDAAVDAALDVTDEMERELAAPGIERVRHHFSICSRYEWMLWDAAWRLERWPVGATRAASV